MKKIVALGAAAALVGGLFAAEPASNPSLVSFTGNASVEWGLDLDTGTTGFKNSTWTEMKIKLFDNGDKATSGDDVWAELVMKVDDEDSCGPNGWQDGAWKGGKNAYIDVAKLHFNNIYVGIKSGDTQVGELDLTGAVRSADPWYHPGRWLKAVGPDKYSQGIVAGYEDDNFNVGVDFRSFEDKDTQYTSSYAIAADAKLKDSNTLVEGLSFGVGAGYNLSDSYYSVSAKKAAVAGGKELLYGKLPKSADGVTYTGIDVEGDGSAATTDKEGWYIKETAAVDASGVDGAAILTDKKGHLLGYSANVGYKFKIDDTYWLKPQAGLTGNYFSSDYDNEKTTINENTVAAGFIFAWGDTNSYGNTGALYFFDDDYGDKAKGLTPGVSAIAYIPLAKTGTHVADGITTKSTEHNALKALIVPSVYSGDLVENLKFAAYSEIGLFNYTETQPTDVVSGNTVTTETFNNTLDGKNTTAIALAAGLRYDIKADDITVTPKASIRYANSCYVANKAAINDVVPGLYRDWAPTKDTGMFPLEQLGEQKTEKDGERKGKLAGDFFNLEAGVEVAGLINNTTFSAHYKSANLLNQIDYSENKDAKGNALKFYNVKLGTFNVGCKIAF